MQWSLICYSIDIQVARNHGRLKSTVCFDVMSEAADAALISSGVMSVLTAMTEVPQMPHAVIFNKFIESYFRWPA